MNGAQEEPLDEKVFRDSNWVLYNGGFVHSNNVLFYFAESPFFDRTSNNSSIFAQALGDMRFQSWLATRKAFEDRLSQLSGLEYVVEYDPLEMNPYHSGPNGIEPSNLWVIAKRLRQKSLGMPDQLTPLAYYYIVGDSIYQAPSVAKVVTNRMLSTVTSLTKMLSVAAPLPSFSVTHGNTYFPPVQKPQNPAQLSISQQSKEKTPQPVSHDTGQSKADTSSEESHSLDFEDTQTLVECIRMSVRYGKEYMDDTPLVGEPGAFRLSKTKDSLAPTSTPQQATRQTSPPKEKTPTPALPPIKTEVPPVESKKPGKSTDRSPTTPGTAPKAKRKKSRMATSSSAA